MKPSVYKHNLDLHQHRNQFGIHNIPFSDHNKSSYGKLNISADYLHNSKQCLPISDINKKWYNLGFHLYLHLQQ